MHLLVLNSNEHKVGSTQSTGMTLGKLQKESRMAKVLRKVNPVNKAKSCDRKCYGIGDIVVESNDS